MEGCDSDMHIGSPYPTPHLSISPFGGLVNEEQARQWVGLENPQLEENC